MNDNQDYLYNCILIKGFDTFLVYILNNYSYFFYFSLIFYKKFYTNKKGIGLIYIIISIILIIDFMIFKNTRNMKIFSLFNKKGIPIRTRSIS